MQEYFKINEALKLLKEKEILTANGKDQFVYRSGKVICRFNGNSLTLTIDMFLELYRDQVFYIYEDDKVFIDDGKDEDYYRYYHK